MPLLISYGFHVFLVASAGSKLVMRWYTAELFDVQLEGGNAFVGDAKDFKEVDPKVLDLAVFVAGVGPGFAEKQCPGFDFVPIKNHLVLTK